MDMQLAGKRALITGSSSGLGAEIARTLASEGVSVVIHGRDAARTHAVAETIRADGGSAMAVCADLEDSADTFALAYAADRAYSGIDILVNNAGARTDGAIGFDIAPADWIRTLQRNLVSAVMLAGHFAPQMRERGWGRIIQISSGLGTTPIAAVPDYAASKAGLNNFTLSLSKSLAKTGVTVNAISPGIIWTPANEAFFGELALAQGRPDDVQGVLDDFVAAEALTVNRIGFPSDIAAGVVYLASPLAGYINGTNLRIDGGSSPSMS